MKKLIASLFATALLVVTSLVLFVPGASARNGGSSCDNLSYRSWDTNGYFGQAHTYQSELFYCD